MTENDLLPQAIQVIERLFEDAPFVRIKEIHQEKAIGNHRPDLVIRLTICRNATPAQERTLIGELRSNGYPGTARDALDQLRYYVGHFPQEGEGPPTPLFIAPFISEETARLCKEAGVGYIDLAGNCFLLFDTVYIERRGNANPHARALNRKTLFAPKAERLLRVLLRAPGRHWQVQELAKEAGVSLGTTSDVKKLLKERDWIRAHEGGFLLTQPEKLLTEWKQRYDFHRSKAREFYSLAVIPETEAALAAACKSAGVRWAFTGFSGAARYAPFVRYNRATAYVEGDMTAIAHEAKLKEVTSGANVTLLAPYDGGAFIDEKELEGDRIVSPLQVYLDLQQSRSRGEEAAQYLYEQRILPGWKQAGGESHAD